MSFVFAALLVAGVPDLPTMDARITALENKVAALEAKCANCCCASNAAPVAAPAAPVQYVQSQCPGGVCSLPSQGVPQFASVSGCPNGQCGGMQQGNSCPGGNCGTFGRDRGGFHPFHRGRR